MAAKKTAAVPETTEPPPRKSRSGPSGPTQTVESRQAKGRVRMELWLDAEDVVLLDAIEVAQGCANRKEAVALAIRTASPLLDKKK